MRIWDHIKSIFASEEKQWGLSSEQLAECRILPTKEEALTHALDIATDEASKYKTLFERKCEEVAGLEAALSTRNRLMGSLEAQLREARSGKS
jgi:hypothetical protein